MGDDINTGVIRSIIFSKYDESYKYTTNYENAEHIQGLYKNNLGRYTETGKPGSFKKIKKSISLRLASARTLIIIGSILTNKVVPRAGCRHIYVTRGSSDPPSCQINESSRRSRHFLLACMRTNIFIIDRFHNSTDIFVPFNCIAGKNDYGRIYIKSFNCR